MARIAHPPTRAERILLILTALFVSIVTAGTCWWYHLNAIPVVHFPTVTPPSPNGFDVFVDADRHIRDGRFSMATDSCLLLTPAQRQDVLTRNAQALQLFRTGLALDCQALRSWEELRDDTGGLRILARLVAFEGRVKAMQGDAEGAVRCWLDGIEFGVKLANNGSAYPVLCGLGYQSIPRFPSQAANIWDTARTLDADDARNAARRMEGLLRAQPPLVDTLRFEQWAGQASLLEQFRTPGWRKSYWEYSSDMACTVKVFTTSNGEMLREYNACMDAIIARAGQPYAVQMAHWPTPHSPIVETEISSITNRLLHEYTVNQTMNTLLTLTFALQAYRAEHGAYPAKLADLAPAYLTKIPDDPFARHGSPQYRRTGKTYLLYSLGPDGVDDGGKPVERYILRGEKGDIVAGVNMQ